MEDTAMVGLPIVPDDGKSDRCAVEIFDLGGVEGVNRTDAGTGTAPPPPLAVCASST
jgi:hypothetical protein